MVVIPGVRRDNIDGAIEVCTVGMGVFLVGMARACIERTFSS